MEDRINYFERMLAENPDNPTGLLVNEYGKAEGTRPRSCSATSRPTSMSLTRGNTLRTSTSGPV